MLENFPFYLVLILVIMLLIMVANKIKVAYPVLLVIAGLLISFVPGIPVLHTNPELIFLIFLPPLLYEAAWGISWKELWHWRRIISSFAFIVVFFTALSVALVANHFIPGISLALGFLLGGIVSPPDAVSVNAILKFVKVPRRMQSILEGESLLNDASSLIIFRFALIAVATGQFVWYEAATSFVWMVAGGIAIGLLIGRIFMKMHKYLPTDANIDIVLTFVAPYLMYIAAEEVHSSGVLAVVTGGLYLSNNRHRFLSSTSRLRFSNVWESFCFVLNGLVFMIIGLELPEITGGLGEVSVPVAIGYGALITLVLVVSRLVSTYGAVAVTLIARNYITVADSRNPGLKGPFVLGWAGMRGVVSLAAALSIPVHLASGAEFPHRNLILFITFVVILMTLLLQGLTLPFIIRKIDVRYENEAETDDEMENQIKQELAEFALNYIKDNYNEELSHHPLLQQTAAKFESVMLNADDTELTEEFKRIYLDVLDQQRVWLIARNRKDGELDEELIRKYLLKIDLEDEKLKVI